MDTAYYDVVGTVNALPLLEHAPETCAITGYKATPRYSPTGERITDIVFHVKQCDDGWNRLWNGERYVNVHPPIFKAKEWPAWSEEDGCRVTYDIVKVKHKLPRQPRWLSGRTVRQFIADELAFNPQTGQFEKTGGVMSYRLEEEADAALVVNSEKDE